MSSDDFFCDPGGGSSSTPRPTTAPVSNPFTLSPSSLAFGIPTAGPSTTIDSVPDCVAGNYCKLKNETLQNSLSQNVTKLESYLNNLFNLPNVSETEYINTIKSNVTCEIFCPSGYYCPTPIKIKECPKGNFCPSGSVVPRKCSFGMNECPEMRTDVPVKTNTLVFLVVIVVAVFIFSWCILPRILIKLFDPFFYYSFCYRKSTVIYDDDDDDEDYNNDGNNGNNQNNINQSASHKQNNDESNKSKSKTKNHNFLSSFKSSGRWSERFQFGSHFWKVREENKNIINSLEPTAGLRSVTPPPFPTQQPQSSQENRQSVSVSGRNKGGNNIGDGNGNNNNNNNNIGDNDNDDEDEEEEDDNGFARFSNTLNNLHSSTGAGTGAIGNNDMLYHRRPRVSHNNNNNTTTNFTDSSRLGENNNNISTRQTAATTNTTAGASSSSFAAGILNSGHSNASAAITTTSFIDSQQAAEVSVWAVLENNVKYERESTKYKYNRNSLKRNNNNTVSSRNNNGGNNNSELSSPSSQNATTIQQFSPFVPRSNVLSTSHYRQSLNRPRMNNNRITSSHSPSNATTNSSATAAMTRAGLRQSLSSSQVQVAAASSSSASTATATSNSITNNNVTNSTHENIVNTANNNNNNNESNKNESRQGNGSVLNSSTSPSNKLSSTMMTSHKHTARRGSTSNPFHHYHHQPVLSMHHIVTGSTREKRRGSEIRRGSVSLNSPRQQQQLSTHQQQQQLSPHHQQQQFSPRQPQHLQHSPRLYQPSSKHQSTKYQYVSTKAPPMMIGGIDVSLPTPMSTRLDLLDIYNLDENEETNNGENNINSPMGSGSGNTNSSRHNAHGIFLFSNKNSRRYSANVIPRHRRRYSSGMDPSTMIQHTNLSNPNSKNNSNNNSKNNSKKNINNNNTTIIEDNENALNNDSLPHHITSNNLHNSMANHNRHQFKINIADINNTINANDIIVFENNVFEHNTFRSDDYLLNDKQQQHDDTSYQYQTTEDFEFVPISIPLSIRFEALYMYHLKSSSSSSSSSLTSTSSPSTITTAETTSAAPSSYSFLPSSLSSYFTHSSSSSSVRSKPAAILNNVHGEIRGACITGLMGPSGAGKTSLLSLLRGKEHFARTEGSLVVNDVRMSDLSALCNITAFVPQDDIMYEEMTVLENAAFAAVLFNKRGYTTVPEVMPMVTYCLEILNISTIKDSLIGGSEKRGVSGGQRKRVSIAMEMVKEAALFCLDEPTSGLDSASSISLLRTLHSLTLTGVTIVTTLHQPRREILDLIDDIILLAPSGRIAFYGSAKELEDHFSKNLGYTLNNNHTSSKFNSINTIANGVNIADYVMDVLTGFVKKDGENQFRDVKEIVNEICEWWETNVYNAPDEDNNDNNNNIDDTIELIADSYDSDNSNNKIVDSNGTNFDDSDVTETANININNDNSGNPSKSTNNINNIEVGNMEMSGTRVRGITLTPFAAHNDLTSSDNGSTLLITQKLKNSNHNKRDAPVKTIFSQIFQGVQRSSDKTDNEDNIDGYEDNLDADDDDTDSSSYLMDTLDSMFEFLLIFYKTFWVSWQRQLHYFYRTFNTYLIDALVFTVLGALITVLYPVMVLNFSSGTTKISGDPITAQVSTFQLTFCLLLTTPGMRLFSNDAFIRRREEDGGLQDIPYFLGKYLGNFMTEVLTFPAFFLLGFYPLSSAAGTFASYYIICLLLQLVVYGLCNFISIIAPPNSRFLMINGLVVIFWAFGGLFTKIENGIATVINTASPFAYSFELNYYYETYTYATVFFQLHTYGDNIPDWTTVLEYHNYGNYTNAVEYRDSYPDRTMYLVQVLIIYAIIGNVAAVISLVLLKDNYKVYRDKKKYILSLFSCCSTTSAKSKTSSSRPTSLMLTGDNNGLLQSLSSKFQLQNNTTNNNTNVHALLNQDSPVRRGNNTNNKTNNNSYNNETENDEESIERDVDNNNNDEMKTMETGMSVKMR